MKIGVVFPQTVEACTDTVFLRDFAQAAEELGYAHLLAYDHVLGANHADRERRLTGPYTEDTPFREPLVLFAYLAAITSRMEFATGVLILPQRQTALVAKQAADVALLSDGRLRLAVGLGWNWVEYVALNEDYTTRGARVSEQVEVLRRLWSEPLVDFVGNEHRIDRASILPRPERPIPIWFGAHAPGAFRRAARIGDGFVFASSRGFDPFTELDAVRAALQEEGRDPAGFGLETFIEYGSTSWDRDVAAFSDAGFTHLCLRTINHGLTTAQQHLDALAEFAAAIGLPATTEGTAT